MRRASFLCAAALALGLVFGGCPGGEDGGNEPSGTFDLSAGDGEGEGWSYGWYGTGWLDIHDGADVVISGEADENTHLRIDENATVTVTLNNATIAPDDYSPFGLLSGANVTLHLQGTNIITAHGQNAGISVPSGTTLRIDGSGSLTVKGNSAGAGIGADGYWEGAGTIVIAGGVIDAEGAGAAAGIGGGWNGPGGNITISGGRGTATSGPAGGPEESFGCACAVGPGFGGFGGSFNGVTQTVALNPWPTTDTTYTWGN